MLLIDLNGSWQMKKTTENNWLSAIVPGSVYNDLILNHQIEDPFFRDNEYKALELSNFDYEYRRVFTVTNDMLQHDKLVLSCEGLDTLCQIFINNKAVAATNNMHRTYELDIKNFLVQGENSIHVVLSSPIKFIEEKQKLDPLNGDYIPGIPHIRKAHHMFGWDWGPKLPDMGIWRNISIRSYDDCRIEDVYITQHHNSNNVSLDLRVRINNWSNLDTYISVKITTPENEIIEEKILASKDEEHINMVIDNPLLWWPNGFGAQPLYKVEVTLLHSKIELDSTSLRIGLRTMTIHKEKDQWGESFAFEVNGIQIFAMGADYIPEDNIIARCSKEKTEKLIKTCIASNFNSIRVWGGAYYPEDYFYDLCDEYGLIVWQDHMYACCVYRFTEDFKENIIAETIDNVKRLRHHASLGLWCGNNELEVAWCDWGWSNKFSPSLKADYIKHFEVVLPQITKEVDPNTFYWLASPCSTGSFDDPNNENYGDMHYWGVWHGKEPFTAYRNYYPRFMSEFGLQSFPCLKTVESFTLPEDRNIFSYVMESHQKSGTGNEKILYYIAENYKYPKDFDSLLYASQLIQAEGIRYGAEHWRRHRGRCMGVVYWQLNDCWPVASWASIDYYGRWKALQYSAKKFFAPILISACEEGTNVSLHVSNETINKVAGKLIWLLRDSKSVIIQSSKKEVEIEALSSIKCEELDFSNTLDTIEKKRNSYLEFKFLVDDKTISSGTVLFVKSKHFGFLNPELQFEVTEKEDKFLIAVSSKAYARFVELDLKSIDGIFSDNYFDLSAGEVYTVELNKSDLSRKACLNELSQEIKVRSLFDSF